MRPPRRRPASDMGNRHGPPDCFERWNTDEEADMPDDIDYGLPATLFARQDGDLPGAESYEPAEFRTLAEAIRHRRTEMSVGYGLLHFRGNEALRSRVNF